MVVRLRLARFGKRHAPVYNIVVAHARTAATSKPLEVLGTYNPIPVPPTQPTEKPTKDIRLDITRAKYWLGVGAQPSNTVWRLFSMFGLLEPRWSVERLKVVEELGNKKELSETEVKKIKEAREKAKADRKAQKGMKAGEKSMAEKEKKRLEGTKRVRLGVKVSMKRRVKGKDIIKD